MGGFSSPFEICPKFLPLFQVSKRALCRHTGHPHNGEPGGPDGSGRSSRPGFCLLCARAIFRTV